MKTQLEVLQSVLDNCPRLSSKNFNSDFLRTMETLGYKFVETNPSKFSQIVNCNEFIRKGEGRIFVQRQEDVQKVLDVIKEVDEDEYDYMFDGFVTVFNERFEWGNQLASVGKFEPNVDAIVKACAGAGVEIKAVTYSDDNY